MKCGNDKHVRRKHLLLARAGNLTGPAAGGNAAKNLTAARTGLVSTQTMLGCSHMAMANTPQFCQGDPRQQVR